ncbi:hypothetical protein ACOSQ3_016847 [Xanthoceras sorbifolium]
MKFPALKQTSHPNITLICNSYFTFLQLPPSLPCILFILMPNIPSTQDASATPTFNIRGFFYYWPSLAIPSNQFVDFMAHIKRSVRPLFTILLLTAFAVTLSFRIIVQGGFFSSFDLDNNILIQPPVLFNSTLLKYAATDVAEHKIKAGNNKWRSGYL